jgi:16S rRNA (guanine966-N2)-methyltransferase
VRIVGGKYRRRKLHASPGSVTRPITDRVKETLFEHLADDLQGRRIADVFAGTGTWGLEALSRDAGGVVFFENDRRALGLLKQNVEMLGVNDQTLCWRTDVCRTSFRPKGVPHLLPYNIVFFDPPYRMTADLAPGKPLYRSLERLARDTVSASDAMLAFRAPRSVPPQCPLCWNRYQTLQFSTMEIHLFQKVHSNLPPS